MEPSILTLKANELLFCCSHVDLDVSSKTSVVIKLFSFHAVRHAYTNLYSKQLVKKLLENFVELYMKRFRSFLKMKLYSMYSFIPTLVLEEKLEY